MANIRKKHQKEANNNKRLKLKKFSKSERFENLKQKNAINRLANVPIPTNQPKRKTKKIDVLSLHTSRIEDENGKEIRVYRDLGDISHKTSEYRYKVISIAKNNILPPNDFKKKYLYYKEDFNRLIKDIHTYNDSLDTKETNEILNKYNHIQTAKIDKKSYIGLQNDLICEFISNVLEPTILLDDTDEITKHIKSYTAKAKALNWTKTATTTRLKIEKDKYYNSAKGLLTLITKTINEHWKTASYKPRWKAIIYNFKNPPNRIKQELLERKTLELWYFKWWASKTNFGEIEITQDEICSTLGIAKKTANNLIKKIKKENEKQGKHINTKGENTKEKVKKWFFENGDYRGANIDCLKELNLSDRTIRNIKK